MSSSDSSDEEAREFMRRCEYMPYMDYGMIDKCPCGGRIIREEAATAAKPDPAKTYWTCNHYQNDGSHARKLWIHGVEEEFEKINTELRQRKENLDKIHNEHSLMRAEIAELHKMVADLRNHLRNV